MARIERYRLAASFVSGMLWKADSYHRPLENETSRRGREVPIIATIGAWTAVVPTANSDEMTCQTPMESDVELMPIKPISSRLDWSPLTEDQAYSSVANASTNLTLSLHTFCTHRPQVTDK